MVAVIIVQVICALLQLSMNGIRNRAGGRDCNKEPISGPMKSRNGKSKMEIGKWKTEIGNVKVNPDFKIRK